MDDVLFPEALCIFAAIAWCFCTGDQDLTNDLTASRERKRDRDDLLRPQAEDRILTVTDYIEHNTNNSGRLQVLCMMLPGNLTLCNPEDPAVIRLSPSLT